MDVPISAPDPLDRISPAVQVGDRLTVRHRLADGTATDVIGFVERLDDRVVIMITADSDVRQVARSLIILARRVPPARGGPDPMRADAEDLQRIAAPAWIDESESIGDWLLRAAGGFTRRANSVLAVGDPGVPVEEAVARVEAWYAERGLPALAQVVSGSAACAALERLGWVDGGPDTLMLVTRLVALRGRVAERRAADAGPAVEIVDRPSVGWTSALLAQRGSPDVELGPAATRVLAGRAPVAFASVGVPGEVPVAIGRGQLNRDWLGLAAMWTDPGRRRSGLAVAIIDALAGWAARRGARNVYLQVEAANPAARSLYDRLGFTRHHEYRYLRPPG